MSLSPDPSSNTKNQQKSGPSDENTIIVNGEHMSFAGGTVSDLLKTLGIKTRAIAVELNRDVVPADQHHSTNVSPGDQLEVVTLVGGG
jgi:thiamine biosynthesis protein ThiS